MTLIPLITALWVVSAHAQTSKTPSGGGGSSGTTSYIRNGSTTPVSQDTTTPANSRPLPVTNFNTSGVPIDPSTSQKQDTGNASLSSIDGKLTTTANGLKVDVQSSILPTGAATAARQDTGNNYLGTISLQLPTSLGAKTGANSLSIVPATDASFPVTALQLPTSLGAKTTANSLSVTMASDQAQLGTVNQGLGGANAWLVVQNTQPLPTGAATSNKQPALGTAGTPSPDVLTVQGSASGTALPISAASLPLPSGAATSALQTSGNSTLTSISGQLPTTLGAKTGANSLSVVQASDANVSKETGGNLDTLVARTPALGQATKALSSPVTLASDQGNIPTTLQSLDLTATSATAVNTDIIAAQSVKGYASINAAVTGVGVGTVTFQGSMDGGTTWSNVIAYAGNAQTTAAVSTTNAVNVFNIPVQGFTLFRMRVTAYTSGTFTGAATALPNAPNDGFLRYVTVTGALPAGTNALGTVTMANPASTTVTSATITVGTTLTRATTNGTAAVSTRRKLVILSAATNTGNCVYGSATVTVANGIVVYPGEKNVFDNDVNDYWLICDTAAQSINILENK